MTILVSVRFSSGRRTLRINICKIYSNREQDRKKWFHFGVKQRYYPVSIDKASSPFCIARKYTSLGIEIQWSPSPVACPLADKQN